MDMPPLETGLVRWWFAPAAAARLARWRAQRDTSRLLIGDKGFILGNTVYPESRRKEIGEVPGTIPRVRKGPTGNGPSLQGRQTGRIEFRLGRAARGGSALGNVALRVDLREELTRARLEWDPVKFEVTNLPEANQFLRREYRAGWNLA